MRKLIALVKGPVGWELKPMTQSGFPFSHTFSRSCVMRSLRPELNLRVGTKRIWHPFACEFSSLQLAGWWARGSGRPSGTQATGGPHMCLPAGGQEAQPAKMTGQQLPGGGVMSSRHYRKTQGRATGVEKLEEVAKCLSHVKLWRNARGSRLARARPHFREHQSADLSSGKGRTGRAPSAPPARGEDLAAGNPRAGALCQWPLSFHLIYPVFTGPCRSEGDAAMAASSQRSSLRPH